MDLYEHIHDPVDDGEDDADAASVLPSMQGVGNTRPYPEALTETSHIRKKIKMATTLTDDKFQLGRYVMVKASDGCPWWLALVTRGAQYYETEAEGRVAKVQVQWYQPPRNEPAMYNERSLFEPCKRGGGAWMDLIDIASVICAVNVPVHPRTGAVKVPSRYLQAR
jgi:hypothetical protein